MITAEQYIPTHPTRWNRWIALEQGASIVDKIIDLKTIPSITIVKQEKPKAKDLSDYTPGHWEFICSECHASIGVVEGGTLDGGLFRFCPNCGAEMER